MADRRHSQDRENCQWCKNRKILWGKNEYGVTRIANLGPLRRLANNGMQRPALHSAADAEVASQFVNRGTYGLSNFSAQETREDFED